MRVKVRQLRSQSTGNSVANQFEIWTPRGYFFQSYNSIILFKCNKTGKTYLDKNDWDYSSTTGKYRNQVLGENISQTRAKINQGIYKLKNLN